MGTFRIATYNVNSIRSRLHIIIPWLREHRPDVLCMQETKVADDRFPAGEFQAAGYQAIFRGSRQYNGVAIASREKPEAVQYGLPDGGPADEDRLIAADIQGNSRREHLRPPGKGAGDGPIRLQAGLVRAAEELFRLAVPARTPRSSGAATSTSPRRRSTSTTPSGFSATSASPPRCGRHSPPSGRAASTTSSASTTRERRAATPSSITGCRKAVERGLGWRVDHILATEPLAARSLGCDIDMKPRLAEKPSDHTILVADFATGEE